MISLTGTNRGKIVPVCLGAVRGGQARGEG